MKIYVDTDNAGEFIDLMKEHPHVEKISVRGNTKDGQFSIVEITKGEKKVGRPRILPIEKITELRRMGKSISLIAKELGLPRSSVYSITKDIDIKQVDTLPNSKEELYSLIQVLKYQIDHAKTISERENFEEMRNAAIKKRNALLK